MTLGSMDHGEGRAAQLVQLEPLIHQVSGHSSLWVLDDVTVCKPLIGREAKFYRTLPPQMRPFTPEFRGTLKVLVERTAEGVAVAALPPNPGERSYLASSRRSGDHRTNRKKVNRVRACNVELASEGEEVGGEMAEEEDEDNLHLPMIGPPIPGMMPAHNPWLKECHQRYLDKLKKKAENKVNVMECILLENLTHIYRVPNVLDLKMGTRQYGDDAPESKRRSQTRKAQHTTTPRLGVRLAGMQVYDRDAKSYVCKNKYVGRELSEDGFQQTLKHFLHNGRRFRTDIVDQIIAKLTDLRKVVGSLDSFRFFTSSLLILYDSYDTKGAPKPKDSVLTPGKDNRISDSRTKDSFSSTAKDKRATSSKDRENFLASSKEKRNSTSKDKDTSLSVAKDKRTSDTKDKEIVSAGYKDRRPDRDNRRSGRDGVTSRSLKKSSSATTASGLPPVVQPTTTTVSTSCLPHQGMLRKLPESCSIPSVSREINVSNHSSGMKDEPVTQNRGDVSVTSSACATAARHSSAISGSDSHSERTETAAAPGALSPAGSEASVQCKATQQVQKSDKTTSVCHSQRITSLPEEQNILKEEIRSVLPLPKGDQLSKKDVKESSAISILPNVDNVSKFKGSQSNTSNFVSPTFPSVSIPNHILNTNDDCKVCTSTTITSCTSTIGNSGKESEVLTCSHISSSNFVPVSLSDRREILDLSATCVSKSLSCMSVNSSVVVNSSCSSDGNKNASSSSSLKPDVSHRSSVEAHSNYIGTRLVSACSQGTESSSRLGSVGEQSTNVDKDLTAPVQTCVTCHSSVPNTNSPSLSNNNVGLDFSQSLDNAEKVFPSSLSIASSLDSLTKSPSPTVLATTCNNNPTLYTSHIVMSQNTASGDVNTTPSRTDQGAAVSSPNAASSSPPVLTRSASVTSSDSACKTKVDIRLIDFAHATHKGMGDATIYSGPDEGLMLGLKSLINIFTDIKEYYAK